MHDRVLDERLQDHARHDGVEHVRGNFAADGETIAKTDALNGEVILEPCQLVCERDFLRHPIIE
ncbi:hypothetical protein D3C83_295180 [compost metagenome]